MNADQHAQYAAAAALSRPFEVCKRKDADSKDKWSCSSSCDSSPADKLKIKASCDDSTCKGHGLMHGVGLQCCPSKK